jgi:hypothetical protein
MNYPWTARCVCGSVRLEASATPLRITVCHCRWCQRRTGTAFGTEVVFQDSDVSTLGQEPVRYRHHSDESGRWLDVFFCPKCGSNLGFTLEAVPGVRTIPAGTLDEPERLSESGIKVRHVFARTRRDWGDLNSEVEVYERHFRPE